MAKSMKPGGGGRFAKLKGKLKRKGVRSPGALAASIGRKKYGKKRFQQMAAKGRKRSTTKRKRKPVRRTTTRRKPTKRRTTRRKPVKRRTTRRATRRRSTRKK